MQHHFLHLSDLHFRIDWPEETGLVCQRLIDDLAAQKSRFPRAHLIFSGDLVQAGGDPSLYPAFGARLDAALAAAGFPFDRRIFIPGNHDISRIALKPKVTLQQGVLGAMVDENTFNNHMPLLSEQYFTPTFQNYAACEKQFARYTCCQHGLGGSGWVLPSGIGVYCLNTALCSFGGIEDSQGKKIADKERLLIDTRSLYRWLAECPCPARILVMHHPAQWLADWARNELEKIIADSFRLVVSGHVHAADAVYSSRGTGGSVHCVAPALFTRKSETLGYSFITLDESTIDVCYRQWTPTHKFVAGTIFADTDTGVKSFPLAQTHSISPTKPPARSPDTLATLQEEFDEAITSYSVKKRIWVERDLVARPETASGQKDQILTSSMTFARNFRSCVIRAPRQFGLTCLGRFLALQHAKEAVTPGGIAMIDTSAVKAHKDGVIKAVKRRCAELQIEQSRLDGVILDNWQEDKPSGIILREIQALLPHTPIVVLHSVDNVAQIAHAAEVDDLSDFEARLANQWVDSY